MEGPFFWTVAVVSAMLVGMGKGGLPMVAVLSVPVLSLVMNPIAGAGLLLPVYLFSDIFGVWIYRHKFDKRIIAIMLPGALVGVALGWSTAAITSDRLVLGIVGGIGLWFSLRVLLKRQVISDTPRQGRVGPGVLWGALTGFTSFICHVGAPPYQAYVQPLGLEKRVFAGTTTILMAIVNLAKLGPYWALGQVSVGSLHMAALLSIPAAISVVIGSRLVAYISPRLFSAIITWMLLLVSIRLLIEAIFNV